MAFLGSFSHLSSLSAFLLFPLFPVCLRRSALQFLLPFGPTFPFFFSVRLFSAFPLFCCLFFFFGFFPLDKFVVVASFPGAPKEGGWNVRFSFSPIKMSFLPSKLVLEAASAFLGSFFHLSSLSAFLLFLLLPVFLLRSALQFLPYIQ